MFEFFWNILMNSRMYCIILQVKDISCTYIRWIVYIMYKKCFDVFFKKLIQTCSSIKVISELIISWFFVFTASHILDTLILILELSFLFESWLRKLKSVIFKFLTFACIHHSIWPLVKWSDSISDVEQTSHAFLEQQGHRKSQCNIQGGY